MLKAERGEQALELLENSDPDAIHLMLLDVWMPGIDGLETLQRAKVLRAELPVIMISGHGTVKTAVEATRLGAFDFLEKPPETEAPGGRAQRPEEAASGDENRRLRLEIDDRYAMVGSSAAIQQVCGDIKRAAPTNATVLIRGESGVGKELVAREVHRLSARADEAYVEVNCAAIPEELIESELFGHEKGAFTGATERQIGKFERRTRARSSWTRSATCACAPRPRCCACSRRARSSGSARRRRSRWTCG